MIDVIDYNTHKGELPPNCAVINMPNSEYHNHKALSKSGLDLVNRSMAHFVYATPFEPTRAMEIGTAIHAAMFEHERFKDEYCLLQNVKDRRASEYKQAVKVHGSERVLVGHEADKVNGMYQSVSLNKEATELLQKDGWSEISFFCLAQDGSQYKCRFDYLTKDGESVDLKKTQDVRYEKFQRSVASYRYHLQQSWYSMVYREATGEELKDFCFLCVEEQPPHANKIYRLDDESLQVAQRQILRDLEDYHNYNWDGSMMPDGLVQATELMSLPSWALDDEAMQEYE